MRRIPVPGEVERGSVGGLGAPERIGAGSAAALLLDAAVWGFGEADETAAAGALVRSDWPVDAE